MTDKESKYGHKEYGVIINRGSVKWIGSLKDKSKIDPKIEITDTDRLNFILENEPDFYGYTNPKSWEMVNKGESYSGPTKKHCIDKAIREIKLEKTIIPG